MGLDVAGQLRLPTVAIRQQLLLVVEQLFMIDNCSLIVGSLNDGVYRAGLLAETTVNALGHVDVISRGPSRAVRARLTLDCDGVGRAGSCA